MKIALIGANGQLAYDLLSVLKEAIPLTHKDIEIGNMLSVRNILGPMCPQIVINTAAYHKVDEVEKNPSLAMKVNFDGASNLAKICRELHAVLVHLSTDYVFSGSKKEPYIENDSIDPINIYGISKGAGEISIRHLWPKHFIIRTSGLYGVAGSSGKGGNFVETMLRLAREGKTLKVVDDQILTPTSTKSLARQIEALIQTQEYGTYHATCQGKCSWYDFAKEIFRKKGLNPDIAPQTTQESGAIAMRPSFSVLQNANLQKVNLDLMPPWEEALDYYLHERA
jgi:dTDP-4-dehydrorhamnose reductase